jgi:transcriptional regulator with GAF, ATPase, and Fis domain/Tfp pilus assembly protein PilF
VYPHKLQHLPEENLDAVFTSVGQKLTDGFSAEAEKLLVETIDNYAHTPAVLANLKRLLSFTLETLGRYKEALETLQPFEDETALARLDIETQLKVITQLAISYNNLSDYPKAVTLLKRTLNRAKENDLTHLFGDIYIALARVYRKLNEYSISRDHAEKALNAFRETGNWRGMAESYQAIATSHYQEGNNEKSLEYFQLAVKIVGERSAPFLLGKIYSDMSGAYCLLHRPQDGIKCLEKSIKFFEQTEHKLNSVIAYNNLGMNLMVFGDWTRAEEMMRRALDLAKEANHVHVAGILDSLGELKLLRGELEEARELLEQGVEFARERKKEWYVVHAMRNLARCLLAQGKTAEAVRKAREAIEICKNMGEKQTINTAGLVLAEGCLLEGDLSGYETELQTIEESSPSSDFFVLGSIQRIRGLAALRAGDKELAVHHFSRSLTIFEAADDLYHAALAHYLIGTNMDEKHIERAVQHLLSAAEIFGRLGVKAQSDAAVKAAEELKNKKPAQEIRVERRKSVSVASQLLTVRLAEATASRELLFRELVAVLNQESKANKFIIAEHDEKKTLYPSITHGFSKTESESLVGKLQEAQYKNDLKNFTRTKNVVVLPLRASSASPAFLIIQPASGAVLMDDSSLQPLLRVVELGMDVIALRDKDKSQAIDQETNPYTSQSLMSGFIHSSPAMTALVEEVYKIRSSDVTVLVTGESGTGKELVSRAIHTISSRKDKIFVPFNCTAVPKELAEGHLFGYRKGAFTGAVSDSPGMIRAADGGTLFLDEVGDLPIEVQPKLLRFLQEGEVQPIGEKRPIKVDVRIIAATNMPLEEKVANGSFREDLYYRLNVIRLRVPPLRERRSEIPPMVNYYINHYSARFGKREIQVMPQTIDLLMVSNWEGNVRQLCNEIQRIVARAEDGEIITPDHLSPELKRAAKPLAPFVENPKIAAIGAYNNANLGGGIFNNPNAVGVNGQAFYNPQANNSQIPAYDRQPSIPAYNIADYSKGTLEQAVSELETHMIKDSLERHGWNISRVARELGLTRRGLYMKMARYGIEKAA